MQGKIVIILWSSKNQFKIRSNSPNSLQFSKSFPTTLLNCPQVMFACLYYSYSQTMLTKNTIHISQKHYSSSPYFTIPENQLCKKSTTFFHSIFKYSLLFHFPFPLLNFHKFSFETAKMFNSMFLSSILHFILLFFMLQYLPNFKWILDTWE